MSLIKSKARVKEHGEVFTAEREVNAMLDLLPEEVFTNPLATFLEPSCGTGNFLVKILERKLSHGDGAVHALKSVSSLYGVDIQEDNVLESRQRMHALASTYILADETADIYRCLATLRTILKRNIVVGDFLKEDVSQRFHRWKWTDDGGLRVPDCMVLEAMGGTQ